MAKYMVLYTGPAFDMSKVSKEEMEASMAEWGAWMKKVGESLVEPGAPMADGGSVVDDGSSATPLDVNGYSIIQADNIADAQKLMSDHPHLNGGEGKYSIHLCEMMPNMMDD